MFQNFLFVCLFVVIYKISVWAAERKVGHYSSSFLMDPVLLPSSLLCRRSSDFTWEPRKLNIRIFLFSLLIYNRYLFFGVFYNFVVGCCILSDNNNNKRR